MAFGDNRAAPGGARRAELGSRSARSSSFAAETPTDAMAADPRVRALVIREVAANTADLASYERIQRVAILPRDLTIEDGELSPTLKVKRRVVEQRYAGLIEQAYAEDLRAREAAPHNAARAGTISTAWNSNERAGAALLAAARRARRPGSARRRRRR